MFHKNVAMTENRISLSLLISEIRRNYNEIWTRWTPVSTEYMYVSCADIYTLALSTVPPLVFKIFILLNRHVSLTKIYKNLKICLLVKIFQILIINSSSIIAFLNTEYLLFFKWFINLKRVILMIPFYAK